MVSTLLVALSLRGVPGLITRRRRPIPIVRYDRVREPRARAQLHALARRLLGGEVPAPAGAYADWRRGETRSGAAATGARIVFFRER